jgi:hypothetical protein
VSDHHDPIPTYPAGQTLSAQALESFHRYGLLRIAGAVTPPHINACEQLVWKEWLKHSGAQPNRPQSWSKINGSVLKPLARLPEFAFTACAAVRLVLDQILGGPWQIAKTGGGFLASAPYGLEDGWQMPSGNWHWDYYSEGGPWVFTPIGRHPTRSGGTLLIAGSHRLVLDFFAALSESQRELPMKQKRQLFASLHPWFAALQEKAGPDAQSFAMKMMDQPLCAGGVDLRIVDVAGEAGDVVIMAQGMIHSVPATVGPRPRCLHVCVPSLV